MRKLFNKFDKFLLLNYPMMWSVQLHRMLLWWLPGMVLLVGLFALENPADYSFRSYAYIIPWLVLMAIISAIFWLIYLFRFNAFKQFGKRPFLDELKHFILIFTGMFMSVLITKSLEMGRYVKVNLIYSRAELYKAVENIERYNVLKWGPSLRYELICRKDYTGDEEFYRQINRLKSPNSTFTKDTGCYYFKIYDYHNYLASQINISNGKEIRETNQQGIKPVIAMPIVIAGEVEKLKQSGDSLKIYADLCSSMKMFGDFPYKPEDIAGKDSLYDFNLHSYYEDALAMNSGVSRETYYSRRAVQTISNCITYTELFGLLPVDVRFRIIFYPAFFISLFVLVFRSMTRRTFLISLGVMALLPLLVTVLTLLLSSGRSDHTAFGVIFTIYVICAGLSIAILDAKTRNVFQGIALNIFTVFSPMLGLFLVMWSESYHNYEFSNDYWLKMGEFFGIVGFIVLLQPLYRQLYVRWFSLPEE